MVIVFGGINVDGVLLAEHLPRRGETVVGATYEQHPGGKGANQAVAAARYGSTVSMVGCVGADANANFALDALARAGINTEAIRVSAHTPTAYASVWVDAAGENEIIVASGANLEISATGLTDDLPDGAINSGTTLLTQLEIPLEQNRIAMSYARERGARVVLNAAPFCPVPETMLQNVDVLIVNEVEAAALSQALQSANPHADEMEAARALSDQFGFTCIVTLGANGAVAFTNGAAWHVATLEVEVLDTTGAGDAFAGTLAAALDEGAGLELALRAGAAAGALACTQLGAQSGLPSRQQIDEALGRIGAVVPWEPDAT